MSKICSESFDALIAEGYTEFIEVDLNSCMTKKKNEATHCSCGKNIHSLKKKRTKTHWWPRCTVTIEIQNAKMKERTQEKMTTVLSPSF